MAYWHDYKNGFTTGMRVQVVNQHKYRNTNLIGKIGTIKSGYGTEVSVMLDGMRNHYSGTGAFYFKASELKIIEECNNNIEENNNMPNVTNYVNAVKIQYVDNVSPSSFIYANFIEDITVGDLCVIKSGHHGLGLAHIVEVIDSNSFETPREVVARVDISDYNDRVEKRVRAAELKDKMKERAKKLQDIALYQMLAKDDPEMMALLEEYQALPMI